MLKPSVIIGVDLGQHLGVALLSEDRLLLRCQAYHIKNLTGATKLNVLFDILTNFFAEVHKDYSAVVCIEEPPSVRNVRAYGALSQMVGVASLAAIRIFHTPPMMMHVSTWKKEIGAEISVPKMLRGKQNQKEKSAHMKESVRNSVIRNMKPGSDEALKDATSTDVFDAIGVALAGAAEIKRSSSIALA